LYFIPLIIIEIIPFLSGFNEKNNLVRIILLIIFTINIGINEELYFRGIIMSLYKNNIIKSIIVSSMLFGIAHITNAFDNTHFLYIIFKIMFTLVLGIIYAEITIITKSIIPGVIIHAIHDFIAMTTNNGISIMTLIILLIYPIIMWKKIKYISSPNCT
jgi:membrane protease YdiL (CAAX protease family)